MGKHLHTTILILLAGVAPAARGAEPACTATRPGELLAAAIAVVADPSLPEGVLEQALAAWRSCPAAGSGFPAFAASERGRSEVRVRYVAGSSQDGRCGFFAGGEIVLFASAYDRNGHVVPCGAPAVNLAHELGHVLGLLDAPRNASCRTLIMAGDAPGAARGRSVHGEECAAADRHWRTPAEGAMLASAWMRVEGSAGAFVPLFESQLEPALAPAFATLALRSEASARVDAPLAPGPSWPSWNALEWR